MNLYKVDTTVQNIPGVLARLTTVFRRFNMNIKSAEATPVDVKKNLHKIYFTIETEKDDRRFAVVMRKIERVVPVIDVKYEKS